MKYFTVAALAAVAQAAQITALNEDAKVHTCAFTSNLNKAKDEDFATILAKHSAADPYTDASFTANESTLFWADAGEDWNKKVWLDGWGRASTNFYDNDKLTLFGDRGVNPLDIRQGKIGNCWIMSAASALAERPHRVENMFHYSGKNEVNPAGVYGVNIFALGVPKTIIVDDFLPLRDWNPILPLQPIFAKFGADNSIWGMILEKALAKFHGNYKHLKGGNPLMAVRTLHGGPWEHVEHSEDGIDADKLWEMLTTHDMNDEIILAGTGGQGHWNQFENGLAKGHAYTILGAHDIGGGIRLVKVRNPWGKEQYEGDWCDWDDRWDDVDKDVKRRIGYEHQWGDGVFFMTVEDYARGFEFTQFVHDVSDGWRGDYYMYLGDETADNCGDNCIKHEFKLKNNSQEEQTVYAAGHTWDDRGYADECVQQGASFLMEIDGQEDNYAFNRSGSDQMAPFKLGAGEEVSGTIRFYWTADTPRDWSITTWTESYTNKIEIIMPGLTDRPSDTHSFTPSEWGGSAVLFEEDVDPNNAAADMSGAADPSLVPPMPDAT